MAVLIKRYPNRKLYDTSTKAYITLEKIAEAIRSGKEIQVVDYATGKDLTALTLTQIILDQEKRQSGLLPMSLLAGLVKAGEETLDAFRQILISPHDFFFNVEEEISKRVELLIHQGELTPEDGHNLQEKLTSASRQQTDTTLLFDGIVRRTLVQYSLPTREDYNKLLSQVDYLTQQVEELSHLKKHSEQTP